LLDAAAEEAGVNLKVVGEPSAYLNGDRDLLFDALTNLVENAIKHGRDSGTVSVAIVKSLDAIDVSVTDDGPGIPAEEIEHVTKRFYRLERSRSTPGNGLGLSLVAAVARLHGVRIAMEDNSPGLRVRLSFQLQGGAMRS
jgi:signal transduction histidine kinase